MKAKAAPAPAAKKGPVAVAKKGPVAVAKTGPVVAAKKVAPAPKKVVAKPAPKVGWGCPFFCVGFVGSSGRCVFSLSYVPVHIAG